MPLGPLLAGKFRPCGNPSGQLERYSPADPGDFIGVFPFAASDVDDAVNAATTVARRWPRSRPHHRVATLRRLEASLRRRASELIVTMTRETGRPQWECTREVNGLSSRIQLTLETMGALGERLDPVVSGGVRSEPFGVVAILGPAMLPLATSHQHIVAAVAAGNAFVWKPSPLVPATAQLYAEALHDAGVDAANVVVGDDAVGAALAAHRGVDCVVFTGTMANGLRLREQGAQRLDQKQIFHVGARNPAVVIGRVAVELAAYEVVTSAFITAGQRCTALSHVYVERSLLDEFISNVVRVVGSISVGAPSAGSFYGPLLSPERLQRVEAVLATASRAGAETLIKGQRLDLEGCYLGPSVHLVEHKRGPRLVAPAVASEAPAPYLTEELFGPDLAIHPVDSLDSAVRACNAEPSLCAALFSDDSASWERFSRDVRSGNLLWNLGSHSVSGRLPFGGTSLGGQGERSGASAIMALRREVSFQERRADHVDLWPGTGAPMAGAEGEEDDFGRE